MGEPEQKQARVALGLCASTAIAGALIVFGVGWTLVLVGLVGSAFSMLWMLGSDARVRR